MHVDINERPADTPLSFHFQGARQVPSLRLHFIGPPCSSPKVQAILAPLAPVTTLRVPSALPFGRTLISIQHCTIRKRFKRFITLDDNNRFCYLLIHCLFRNPDRSIRPMTILHGLQFSSPSSYYHKTSPVILPELLPHLRCPLLPKFFL